MMTKSKRSEHESSVGSDVMEIEAKKRAPCPCSSYYIVTFATSSITILPCLKLGIGLKKKAWVAF